MGTLDDTQAGPRFSFSQDDDMQESVTFSEKRKREQYLTEDGAGEAEEGAHEELHNGDDGFSFEFSSAVSLDLPPADGMLSAEELFFNGKLRPLFRNSAFDHGDEETPQNLSSVLPPASKDEELCETLGNGSTDVEVESMGQDMVMAVCHKEKAGMPEFRVEHSLPMVKTSLHESLAMAKQHLRTLHESPRCLSMTVEGSRGQPRRSCVSLNSSRCSSPSRSTHLSATFSQPRTTPTSPKASSHKSRKFMALFKLGKSSSKDSMPAEGMTNSKRSFWPFSRSNSAGESKSSHGLFPLPRRSNSAGESKTTSSALLPNSGERKGRPPDLAAAALAASAKKLQAVHCNHQQADRKGLPPLPSSNIRRASSCFVPPNCGVDSIALSRTLAVSASMPKSSSLTTTLSSSSLSSAFTPTTSTSSSMITSSSLNMSSSSSPCSLCISSSLSTTPLPALSESTPIAYDARALASTSTGQVKNETTTAVDSPLSTIRENSVTGSPVMHARHASANVPGRHIARASPAQPWGNPNMGSSLRHNADRYGNNARGGLVRAKDVLSRESASIRVTPILNVPSCITPSSKSKIFNLGNLFTKKEKAAKGYTMLVSTDSQDGG